jgi:hypothetical protein
MIVHVSSVMKRLLVLLVPVITVAGCVTVVPPQGAGPSQGGSLPPPRLWHLKPTLPTFRRAT